jgi:uncharacterized protein YacL
MIETIQLIQTVILLALILILLSRLGVSPEKASKKVILDSSVLIDGRIIDIVGAGFAHHTLVIPRFVTREIQKLADGSDSERRARARFGLDVAQRLQDSKNCKVVISTKDYKKIKEVDDKLVALAISLGADLYTTDYNLNKVATVEGVKVLNINELAGALRPVALPGETQKVKIIQKGSGRGQGVGYLDDGTMVVVENAANKMQKYVTVEIARIHQSDSGKMMFGNIKNGNGKNGNGHKQQ